MRGADLPSYTRAIGDNDWPSMERGSDLQTHTVDQRGEPSHSPPW